mgnify:FL=1
MDIQAGKMVLSKNQINRLHELKHSLVNGVMLTESGELVINATRSLSESEIESVIQALESLPDTAQLDPVKDIKDKDNKDINLSDVITVLRLKGIL